MTTKFIDATIENSRDDLSSTAGGTLTNDVRITYDDTQAPGDLVNAAQRLVDVMRKELT